MIYCANCGTSLQDDALFCPECGAKTDKAETPAKISTAESSPTPIKTAQQEPVITPSTPLVEAKPVIEAPPPPPPKKFCRNCGKEVAAGAYACINCGLPPMKAFNFCPSCGANCHQDAVICIKCGVGLDSQDSKPSSTTIQSQEISKSYCRNCGKEVLKGAVACLGCGLPPGKSKNFCPSCGSETHNEAVICIKCGTALEQFAALQIQQSNSSIQKTTPTAANQTSNVVLIGTQKSVGTAFILTFLFGPLGLLYASVVGGIIMFFIGIVLFIAIPIAGGVIAWIICIIWAVVAAQNSNQAALNKAGNISNNLNR